MFRVNPCSKEAAESRIGDHLRTLAAKGAPVESYVEERSRGSAHFHLLYEHAPVGLFGIENGTLLTHFSLDSERWTRSHEAFLAAIQTQQVNEALVPSYDDGFLSLAFDRHRSVKVQADLFFCWNGVEAKSELPRVQLERATHADALFIRESTGGFLEARSDEIDSGILSIVKTGEVVRGFGVSEQGRFVPQNVSIGMFVLPEHRGQGYGTAILESQKQQAAALGKKIVSGCWHYNHQSRRSLERIGMVATSRLLRFGF